MTVAELINELTAFDPDSLVFIKVMQNKINNIVIKKVVSVEDESGNVVIIPTDLSELTEDELRYVYAMIDEVDCGVG